MHLHNVSGGILAGDRLSLDIAAGPGAAAQITSTGATRLYRHRSGAPDSEQHISIRVENGALVEYLPDPLIPFRGSRHRQRTTVTLAGGATFFWWEIVAPGRQAMGEEFEFDTLRIETRIESALRPLLLEEILLEPHSRSLKSNARLGGYRYAASFYAIQTGRSPADCRNLEARLNQIALQQSSAGTIWGASALVSDGVVVRGLSATSRDLTAQLTRFWSAARSFLTGVDAVPPRKLK